jgi:endo-1,4-beta-xylanase
MVLKRLVTSAATIAILGCSDGAEKGASVPPFIGDSSAAPGAGAPPVDTAAVPGPAPTPANADPAAGAAPTAGQAPTEGQNPDNIGIDNTEGSGAEPGGGEGSSEMGAGAEQGNGMEQSGMESPPPGEEAQEPQPVPEEPEPIVRPPLDCGAPPPQLQGGVQGCDVNSLGTAAGQDWFLWYRDAGGGNCMTAYDNLSGAFSAQWNNPGDFLARIGFWFDETQTHQELGEIGADMAFTRQGSGGGFSYIGIYGWTVNPLVEFYIVEDAFGGPPRTFEPTTQHGNFTVDGGQYAVHSDQRINQPTITGMNGDFLQILSVRQGARNCGHVSISEHFRQWESRGLNLGLMKEAKILVEAGGGNGSITFTHANVTVTPPE